MNLENLVHITLLLAFLILSSTTEAFGLNAGRDFKSKRGLKQSLSLKSLSETVKENKNAFPMKLAMTGGGVVDMENSKSTMTQSIFNLVKNIMGAGMLSLPAGVAAFSDGKSAIYPCSLIIAVLGALSAYTFSLVGRSCAETKAESYEQAWAKSVSPKSSILPAAGCVATCFAACLAYTIIIGDTFSALAATFNAPAKIAARSTVIGAISVLVLLPLSLLKNLSALGYTSMLGSIGLIYTAVMMGIRFLDGSYAAGGRFFKLLTDSSKPVFGTKSSSPLLFLVLVSMLGTSFEAHFNAPLFFKELKNNTIPRYDFLVYTSFAVSVVTMIAVTAFGFLTFGGSSAGFILNNYASADKLATIARVFVGFSIIFSYPLCFVGLRDGLMEMMGNNKPTDSQRTAWTVGLLGLVSVLSMFLKDLGFVNSFGGALVASGIVYIFPAIMFLAPLRRKMKQGVLKIQGLKRFQEFVNYGVVVTGIAFGALGAVISVLESFFPYILSP